MAALLSFIVVLAVQAVFFYAAARITGNKTPYGVLFMIALIGAVCSMITIARLGFLVGLIVVLILLVNWGKMSWLSAILTVVLAYVLAFAATFVLSLLMGISLFGPDETAAPAAALIQSGLNIPTLVQ